MKKLLLVAALYLTASVPALAQGTCSIPNAMPTISGTGIKFTDYGTNTWGEVSRQAYDVGEPEDWIMLMGEAGLESALADKKYNEYGWYECDFSGAHEAFESLKSDLPQDTAAQRIWLQNQDHVFEACMKQQAPELEPVGSPAQAAAEYEYQKAARAYHIDPKAPRLEADLRAIAYTAGHPRQRDAARTLVRLLASQKGLKAAWQETENFKTGASTAPVYPFIEDTRFILMSLEDKGDLETQQKILRWLLDVVEGRDRVPASLDVSARTGLEESRKGDALRRLDDYVTEALYEDSGNPDKPYKMTLDWWLGDMPLESVKKQAVRTVIKDSDLLAWLYVNATRSFEPLTRMHDTASPVRTQQKRLSEFAFRKYTDCKGAEWLLPALTLAVREMPQAADMVKAAESALGEKSLKSVQAQFRKKLWTELVRFHLLDGRYDAALDTLFRTDIDSFIGDSRAGTLIETLEWFIHRGEFDWARRVIARNTGGNAIPTDNGYYSADPRYQAYALMLAKEPEDLLQLLATLDDNTASLPVVSPMLALLPAATMLELAEVETLGASTRMAFARTALTRAWLLDEPEKMARAARAIENLDATGDKSPLRLARAGTLDALLFFLRHPRFNATSPVFEGSPYGDDAMPWNGQEIDQYNHNDNNWWCAYKPERITISLRDSWALMPGDTQLAIDPKMFAETRAAAFEAHPIFRLIDKREQAALAALPSGPYLLAQQAAAYAKGPRGWWGWIIGDDRIPEALHLAVRATRYGCDKDGPKGTVSQDAFWALHKLYGKTPWAEATPYWFD